MSHHVTDGRLLKMMEVLNRRQATLRIVLEEIHNPKNISAIMRTCDSAGVQYVHVIYTGLKPLVLDADITKGAHQWITMTVHTSTDECLSELKRMGYAIYCTQIDVTAKDFTEVDYTRPVAIVFGNEQRGVSDVALSFADERIVIPQMGFSQSLNVSASVAVILYEALKQRRAAGMYDEPTMDDAERRKVLNEWLEREGRSGFGNLQS
ncbi:MAG: RNA methyltransferase [Armatimonadota bacterium]|nr:RNA methyltransferase [Armatimonadota bacterium]MCX7776530.1 RNA methyltransferase [Armatimonadota bacterium]MDW8024329.1 RNA methyltransferase [Armatimonadota bacterium]